VCGLALVALAGARAVSGAGAVSVRVPITRDTTIRGGSYAAVTDNGTLLATRLSSDPSFTRRALLDFDTSAIPSGATVTSATLTLIVHWGGTLSQRAVAVYNLTTPFVAAQATWDVASASTPWKTPGGDIGREYARTAVANTAGAKATFAVTGLVQAAVSGSGSRHSLMALLDVGDLATGRDGYRDYYSGNAGDVSLRPMLDVAYTTSPSTTPGLPAFSHVFTILLENKEYSQVIGSSAAPYINSLARQYGLATNYTGVTHPSLPNYMALTGGETVFTTDCVGCTTPARNVFDEAVDAGRHWKAYMESMPTVCGTTDTTLYAQKHNPFVHYDDVVKNATRCANHVVPFTQFSTDLKAGALPDYVWITPNMCDDMHNCSIATGDTWLSTVVPQIINSTSFKNSVLFILWDEGTTNTGGGGLIPALVVSPFTPAGFRWAGALDHYDVLRTIEDAWKLAPLGKSASATAMKEFFGGR
jgi:acid phosphatase